MTDAAGITRRLVGLVFCLIVLASCGRGKQSTPDAADSHQQMVQLLREIRVVTSPQDPFLGTEELNILRRTLRAKLGRLSATEHFELLMGVGELELRQGENKLAIQHFLAAHDLAKEHGQNAQHAALRLAVAYLRLGEAENCVHCHTGESCILPIREGGIHQVSTGSERAIEYCELVLRENPDDVTARWLLNIAHKTLGRYPQDVPEQFRIAPKRFAVDSDFPQFKNVAPSLGLDTMSLLGGAGRWRTISIMMG